MANRNRWFGWAILATFLGGASDLQAQVIGTFQWQFAPFCNVVTMTVEQRGATFLLTGVDDQCGQPVSAAASGTAHINPDGTVGIGLTVVRPDGWAIHNTVSLNLSNFSGTWTDAYGGSGTFVFSPPSPAAGPPRTITIRGTYAINFQAAGAGHNGISTISFGQTLAAAPTAVAANFIKVGTAPTANCPGSSANPEAAPGHLCVYERTEDNVQAGRCIVRVGTSFSCNQADRFGAAIFAESVAAGAAASQGSWALTVP